MKFEFKHSITCDVCGTGYGEASPLGRYECPISHSTLYMCEECADIEEEEELSPQDELDYLEKIGEV